MLSNRSNLSPETIEYVGKIIDLDRYNGRVNIIQPPNPLIQFQMAEKISLKNKVNSDYREPLNGNVEENLLSQVFFSAGNIQIIQNALRAGVYKLSQNKYVIPNQNLNNLKIIMRSIYLTYAEQRNYNITGQVEELNKLVLDYCIPTVFNEARGYEKYTQDQSTLVVPMSLPLHHDRQYKQLELKPYV